MIWTRRITISATESWSFRRTRLFRPVFGSDRYRRSVMLANWPCVSHFSCLFQGIWDSRPACGSSTRAGFGFSVAQPARRVHATKRSNDAIVRLGIRASINNGVTRLYLDATRQAISHNIANCCRRFNGRNANFSDRCPASQNKHFRVGLHALVLAKVQHHKIISAVDREDRSTNCSAKDRFSPLDRDFWTPHLCPAGLHFFCQQCLL